MVCLNRSLGACRIVAVVVEHERHRCVLAKVEGHPVRENVCACCDLRGRAVVGITGHLVLVVGVERRDAVDRLLRVEHAGCYDGIAAVRHALHREGGASRGAADNEGVSVYRDGTEHGKLVAHLVDRHGAYKRRLLDLVGREAVAHLHVARQRIVVRQRHFWDGRLGPVGLEAASGGFGQPRTALDREREQVVDAVADGCIAAEAHRLQVRHVCGCDGRAADLCKCERRLGDARFVGGGHLHGERHRIDEHAVGSGGGDPALRVVRDNDGYVARPRAPVGMQALGAHAHLPAALRQRHRCALGGGERFGDCLAADKLKLRGALRRAVLMVRHP